MIPRVTEARYVAGQTIWLRFSDGAAGEAVEAAGGRANKARRGHLGQHCRGPDALELTDAEREELDRRWTAYERDPSVGSPWAEVRARIQRNG